MGVSRIPGRVVWVRSWTGAVTDRAVSMIPGPLSRTLPGKEGINRAESNFDREAMVPYYVVSVCAVV